MEEKKDANKTDRLNRQSRLVKLEIVNERIGKAEGMLKNITSRGAGIKTTALLFEGERIALCIRNVPPIWGTVKWQKAEVVGLQFLELFDLDALNFFNKHQAEGIFRDNDGYHVYDRFNPTDGEGYSRPGFNL